MELQQIEQHAITICCSFLVGTFVAEKLSICFYG